MTETDHALDRYGSDLAAAFARALARRRSRRRTLRATAAVLVAAGVFGTVAVASGIGPDLQLDPRKWDVVAAGSVDDGRGGFVAARGRDDGSESTFLHELDAGLDRYDAFLLHERTRTAAHAASGFRIRTERGPLCSRAELTRAETVALAALGATFSAGAAPAATSTVAASAVASAFAEAPCRGLEYAAERASFAYAGIEPASMLMPGAR